MKVVLSGYILCVELLTLNAPIVRVNVRYIFVPYMLIVTLLQY